MTSLTFHLSRALARSWGPGDEVVVTELDHHGNVDPWLHATLDRGATVRSGAGDSPMAKLDDEALAETINERTKLVAIGAASNAVRHDPRRRTDRRDGPIASARSPSSTLCMLRRTSSPTSKRSAATSSRARRTSSTARTSASCTDEGELIEELDVPKLAPAPDTGPERLETGTQNHEAIAGATAAVDFLASIGTRRDPARGVDAMLARMTTSATDCSSACGTALPRSRASRCTDVRRAGRGRRRSRSPFAIATTAHVAAALRRPRGVRFGRQLLRADADRASRGPGDGVVRAGCACYTTDDEVDRLVELASDELAHGSILSEHGRRTMAGIAPGCVVRRRTACRQRRRRSSPDAIEALGYSTLWLPEVVGRDPFAHIAYLATQTSSLGFATGIANIHHRLPGMMKQAANTVAEQSGGRFTLGIGVSHQTIVEGLRRPLLRQAAHDDAPLPRGDGRVPVHGRRSGRAAAASARRARPEDARARRPRRPTARTRTGRHPSTRRRRARSSARTSSCASSRRSCCRPIRPRRAGRRSPRSSIYADLPNYRNNWLRLGYTNEQIDARDDALHRRRRRVGDGRADRDAPASAPRRRREPRLHPGARPGEPVPSGRTRARSTRAVVSQTRASGAARPATSTRVRKIVPPRVGSSVLSAVTT